MILHSEHPGASVPAAEGREMEVEREGRDNSPDFTRFCTLRIPMQPSAREREVKGEGKQEREGVTGPELPRPPSHEVAPRPRPLPIAIAGPAPGGSR